MAVCHFPSQTAALDHLAVKGFRRQADTDLWINSAAGVHARLMNSVRGWHLYLYEAVSPQQRAFKRLARYL